MGKKMLIGLLKASGQVQTLEVSENDFLSLYLEQERLNVHAAYRWFVVGHPEETETRLGYQVQIGGRCWDVMKTGSAQ